MANLNPVYDAAIERSTISNKLDDSWNRAEIYSNNAIASARTMNDTIQSLLDATQIVDVAVDVPDDSLVDFQAPAKPVKPNGLEVVMPATPSVGITFDETPYTSGLLELLIRRLTEISAGEATGLTPAVSAAITARFVDHAVQDARSGKVLAAQQWSSWGHVLPDGVLLAKIQAADQGMLDASSGAARDTMIKELDLEQNNLQFVMQQAVALESTLMNYTSGMHGREIEVKKTSIQAVLDLFGKEIEKETTRVKALLDQLSADVQVFNASNEGEKARVEVQADIIRTRVDKVARLAQVEIENARNKLQKLQLNLSSVGDVMKMQTQVFSQLGTAALTVVNLSASMGTATHFGYSESNSSSVSTSTSIHINQ